MHPCYRSAHLRTFVGPPGAWPRLHFSINHISHLPRSHADSPTRRLLGYAHVPCGTLPSPASHARFKSGSTHRTVAIVKAWPRPRQAAMDASGGPPNALVPAGTYLCRPMLYYAQGILWRWDSTVQAPRGTPDRLQTLETTPRRPGPRGWVRWARRWRDKNAQEWPIHPSVQSMVWLSAAASTTYYPVQ